MAEVWLAAPQANPGETVVLKRPLPIFARDRAFVEMFAHEARLTARLGHRNIVRVLEYGDVDGQPYLALEHIDGIDLRALLRLLARRRARLPEGAAAYIACEVALALSYAHAISDDDGRLLRLVHRDVSPSNIMLRRDGAVKLLDFGIAKALDQLGDVRTRTGARKGKLRYMAPEQVVGEGLFDHRADQYALGVVLHEMLTGHHLFQSRNELLLMETILAGVISPPSSTLPFIPAELDAICMRSLARDPAARYAECGTLAYELSREANRAGWDAASMARLLNEHIVVEESTATLQATKPTMVPATAAGMTTAGRAPLAVASALLLIAAAVVAWQWLRPPAAEPTPLGVGAPAPQATSTTWPEPAPTPPATPTSKQGPSPTRRRAAAPVPATVPRGELANPFGKP